MFNRGWKDKKSSVWMADDTSNTSVPKRTEQLRGVTLVCTVMKILLRVFRKLFNLLLNTRNTRLYILCKQVIQKS